MLIFICRQSVSTKLPVVYYIRRSPHHLVFQNKWRVNVINIGWAFTRLTHVIPHAAIMWILLLVKQRQY